MGIEQTTERTRIASQGLVQFGAFQDFSNHYGLCSIYCRCNTLVLKTTVPGLPEMAFGSSCFGARAIVYSLQMLSTAEKSSLEFAHGAQCGAEVLRQNHSSNGCLGESEAAKHF